MHEDLEITEAAEHLVKLGAKEDQIAIENMIFDYLENNTEYHHIFVNDITYRPCIEDAVDEICKQLGVDPYHYYHAKE